MNLLLLHFIAFLATGSAFADLRHSNEPRFEADVDPRRRELEKLLPFSGHNLTGTLGKALDIVVNAPVGINRSRRFPMYEKYARTLLNYLTLDDRYDEEIIEPTPEKQPRYDHPDEDYCSPTASFGSGRRTQFKVMQRIVDLDARNLSEASIRAQYPWYKRQYLSDFKNCVLKGGTNTMKRDEIDKIVKGRVDSMIAEALPIRTYMIRAFARRAARSLNARGWFKPTRRWVDGFKKRNRLSTRKVTKRVGRPQFVDREKIEEDLLTFLKDYDYFAKFFDKRSVWNIDQTGTEYEMSNQRIIAPRGARDVYLRIDSLNKASHTFTGQPILTRDGRLVGKMTLVMQEDSDQFGPIIAPRVAELERELGNIKVFASKSGKMTSKLIADWVHQVLEPAIREEYHPSPDLPTYQPSEEDCSFQDVILSYEAGACGTRGWFEDGMNETCLHETRTRIREIIERPKIMLLADSWSGHSSEKMKSTIRMIGVKPLTIPPHTTDMVQPLDVGFFRQLKIFIRRITEEAIVSDRIAEITSRESIIKLISIIFNQLQAPAYRDLWRFAWRHTDAGYSEDELANDPPANVNSIQFSFDPAAECSVSNCTEDVVVQSSYNRDHFCLTHFLEKRSFHNVDPDGDAIDMDAPPGPSSRSDNDEEEEDNDEATVVPVPRDRVGMIIEEIIYGD